MYSVLLGYEATSVRILIQTFRVDVVPSSSGFISNTDCRWRRNTAFERTSGSGYPLTRQHIPEILSYTGCNTWSAWWNWYTSISRYTSRVPCIWDAAIISTRYSTACLIDCFFIRTGNQELILSSGVVVWLSLMLNLLLSLSSYVNPTRGTVTYLLTPKVLYVGSCFNHVSSLFQCRIWQYSGFASAEISAAMVCSRLNSFRFPCMIENLRGRSLRILCFA